MKTLPSLVLAFMVVFLGLGLMLAFSQPWLLFGLPSFTKSVKVTAPGEDRGYYYRFKANFAYKGEPLEFDIVVGCNVRITTYKDNDRTVEVGIAPMAYGLKTKDGRGVVVRPPEACRGETTDNGKVPARLLPLVVTYENADQPWFGLAYVTEDAYASPISELKFFGATISRATREEWQEWRRTQAPKNFVTYELLGINEKNMWDFPRWKPGYRVMASGCVCASWVKLPESVRDLARRFWPDDKPLYWFPGWPMRNALWDALVVPQQPAIFDGNRFLDYRYEYALFGAGDAGAKGLPRRAPGAVIFFKGYVAGDTYPARLDRTINRFPDGELPPEIKAKPRAPKADVEARSALRGFAFCDDTVFKIEDVPGGFYGAPIIPNKINGEAISEELESWSRGPDLVFERDEFVIFPHLYQIGSIFGGL